MNQKERFDLVVSLGETLLSNGGEISRTNELMYLAAEAIWPGAVQCLYHRQRRVCFRTGGRSAVRLSGAPCAADLHPSRPGRGLERTVPPYFRRGSHSGAGAGRCSAHPHHSRRPAAGADPGCRRGQLLLLPHFRRRVAGLRSGVLYRVSCCACSVCLSAPGGRRPKL